MNNFCFVILNYNTYDDTLNCVKYIKKLDNQKNIEIVIVDNASPDNSGEKLEKYYINDKHITILLSKKNLGFAKGNNIGFEYAKNKLKANYIIMCNSDTEILNKDFCNRVSTDFKKYNFSLLGPKIILPDNSIQGFIVNGVPETKNIYKLILSVYINYFKVLFNINSKQNKNMKETHYKDEISINKTLSGCFWVFSENYIKKFNGIDDRTFMYGEEILLQIRLHNNKLLSLYDPEIIINHKVGTSVSTDHKNELKKFIFFKKNVIKAMKIALKEIKKR